MLLLGAPGQPCVLTLLLLQVAVRGCDPGVFFGRGTTTAEQGRSFPQGANATWMATTVVFEEMDPSTGMDVFLSTTVATGCAGGYIGAQIHQGSPTLFTDFALWDFEDWRMPAAAQAAEFNTSSTTNVSGHCDRYDNEGHGTQCGFGDGPDKWVWELGTPYTFNLSLSTSNASGALFNALIRDEKCVELWLTDGSMILTCPLYQHGILADVALSGLGRSTSSGRFSLPTQPHCARAGQTATSHRQGWTAVGSSSRPVRTCIAGFFQEIYTGGNFTSVATISPYFGGVEGVEGGVVYPSNMSDCVRAAAITHGCYGGCALGTVTRLTASAGGWRGGGGATDTVAAPAHGGCHNETSKHCLHPHCKTADAPSTMTFESGKSIQAPADWMPPWAKVLPGGVDRDGPIPPPKPDSCLFLSSTTLSGGLTFPPHWGVVQLQWPSPKTQADAEAEYCGCGAPPKPRCWEAALQPSCPSLTASGWCPRTEHPR